MAFGWLGLVSRVVHKFVVLNIYDDYRASKMANTKTDPLKIDSRKIDPPRFGNRTERIMFGDLSHEKMCVELLSAKSSHPFTINLDRRIKYGLDYSVPEVHASIYWFKYKRDKYTVNLLARILWDEIIFEISDKLDARHKICEWFMSPAPSTSFELGKKDWDHNKDLLFELEKIILESYTRQGVKEKLREKIKFVPTSLFKINRARDGLDMNKKLGRRGRFGKTADKFILAEEIEMDNDRGLIIFDDVSTTGATLLGLSVSAERLRPKIIILISVAH